MSRACVKGLSKTTTEAKIRQHFAERYEVTDVKLVRTREGKSRQFAFVGFRSDKQCQEAIVYFNNTYLDTSKISIEVAKKATDVIATIMSSGSTTKAKTTNDSPNNDNDVKNDSEGNKSKLTVRSKYTKKKIEEMKAAAKVLAEPSSSEVEAAASKTKAKSKTEEERDAKLAKQKADFIEVMQPRSKNKFWSNDEALQPEVQPGFDNQDAEEGGDSDSDSSGDEEDYNITGGGSDKLQSAKSAAAEGVSDRAYLKAKVKANFSDSDDDDDDDDEKDDGNDGSGDDAAKTTDDATDRHQQQQGEEPKEEEDDTGRLFVRNLPFSCTEEELSALFAAYGAVAETHIPLDLEKRGKGFGFVQFMMPDDAASAVAALDGSAFQGRLIHVMVSKRPREVDVTAALKASGVKLSSFQLKKEEERRKKAGQQEGWNSSFVRSDAVVDSLASTYGVQKSDILDTNIKSGDMAVRLAVGETNIIQENRAYFSSHGVDITALESSGSSTKSSKRSTTTLLIKNLPHELVEEELESMFNKFGTVTSFLIPQSRTVALIDFDQPADARAAFKGLAYRKYKHVPLYLEWAPERVIDKDKAAKAGGGASTKKGKEDSKKKASAHAVGDSKGGFDEGAEYGTVYVKNLNFSSSEDTLREHLRKLNVMGVRTVSLPTKVKNNATLLLGYGFIEFKSPTEAASSLAKINGSILDEHKLEAKASDKRLSTAPASKKRSSDNSSNSAKLVVRNVAFQATQNDIKSLFAAFGAVKRVRIPKKMSGEHRGFAFVDLATPQEAAAAKDALQSTHLYGRHLIVEWAKEGEDELASMRKKAKLDSSKLLLSSHKEDADQGRKRKKGSGEEMKDEEFDFNEDMGDFDDDDDDNGG